MSRSIRRMSLVATLALFTLAGRAALAEPTVLSVDQGASKLVYTIVHKLHTSVGTSKKVEGKALVQPDGALQIMVRAPIASFDSGNSGRDEHMQETLEAPKFPYVTFKAVSKLAWPTTFPTTTPLRVAGQLEFHGKRMPETIPVSVTFTSATEAHVTSKFAVSLEKYEVERPSLLMMKINDDCQIEMDLVLKK
jgi:polyisoprenoid-binding protein YceI